MVLLLEFVPFSLFSLLMLFNILRIDKKVIFLFSFNDIICFTSEILSVSFRLYKFHDYNKQL